MTLKKVKIKMCPAVVDPQLLKDIVYKGNAFLTILKEIIKTNVYHKLFLAPC